jgi:arylsulfatase A-like enzyme
MPRLLALGLVLGLLAPACRAPARRRPNVVVVVIDTLRADALGSYGNPRGPTPFLDELAGGGMRYANAYATSSWTIPSVASLLTSRYPSQHGVTSLLSVMPGDEPTFVRKLAELGYVTAGFTANGAIGPAFAHAGFSTWAICATVAHKVRTATLGRKSLQWIDRARASHPDRPLFVYYQLMEPHFPYEPRHPPAVVSALDAPFVPKAHWKTFHPGANFTRLEAESALLAPWDVAIMKALYERAVEDVDADLRTLFAELRLRGILDDAVVVVTSDHGEEFHEHGLMFHGATLYEEVIRVPLIVLAPGVAGQVSEKRVSLLDVAPTIFRLVGATPDPIFEGRALLDPATKQRDVVSELLTPPYGDARHSEAIIRDSLKMLVRTNEAGLTGSEVYDLALDPEEHAVPERRLWMRSIPLLASLRIMKGTMSATASPTPPTVPLSDQTRARLRALGYVE